MKNLFLMFVILFFVFQDVCASSEIVQTYCKNDKFGLILNEQIITDAIYKKLIRIGDNSWLFMQGTKYGIISNSGEILVPARYTKAQRFSGGKFVRLGRDEKFAVFDEYGRAVVSEEYSEIEILYGRMFLVKKDYKYGLIGYDGNMILSPVAEDIYMPKPNILKINYDGTWYEIEQKNRGEMKLPQKLADIEYYKDEFKITQLAQKPIVSTGYGVVCVSDYFVKIFSSISPAYEQTIDELILNHGADTATILMKPSWLVKFPFVYAKKYVNTIKAPSDGALNSIKSNLKNKIKN